MRTDIAQNFTQAFDQIADQTGVQTAKQVGKQDDGQNNSQSDGQSPIDNIDHDFADNDGLQRRRSSGITQFDPLVTSPLTLTDGERDCLRHIYNHRTSMDIAQIFDVSPHMVDMRLRTAMRTLGVTSLIEAARDRDLHGTG